MIMQDPTTTGAPWFRGILNVDPSKLNHTNQITWDGLAPTPQRITEDDLHFESGTGMARGTVREESVLEPMMKVKLFAVPRFPIQKYSSSGLDHVYRRFLDGKELDESEILDLDSSVAQEAMLPIFTGYLNSVTHSYQGGSATVSISARDVLCWLDYSTLVITPSFNITNLENLAWYDRQRAGSQIWTIQFAGLPADEIVRRVFVGRPIVTM
ncbi:MAG: hypothetical protein KKD44_27325, partial [Proteobacteria bacterium]|nr:hypothetical protein [Pseudomonadota bacterium]